MATAQTVNATQSVNKITDLTANKKDAKQNKPAGKAVPATVALVRPNAKAHIRALFAKVGDVKTAEEVFHYTDAAGKQQAFHAVTIKTHLTDLKNPNYAGKLGTISIVKQTDGTYKRVA